jgi:hypothetical protein
MWRVIYMNTNIHILSHLAPFYLEWEIFQTKAVEKIETHILCSTIYFIKSRHLWDNVEKYCRWAGHRWQHGACALYAGYLMLQIRALRLCNSRCFPTAKVVARKRLNVTLYAHFVSCYPFTSICTLTQKWASHRDTPAHLTSVIKWPQI